ncbi:MAG TPA: cellulase family glycosylhydrolase [Steroidobacteraceae bacterium]|nr:cellulase family glycosylhydrolase [Steroidobacteraceae bacterium]
MKSSMTYALVALLCAFFLVPTSAEAGFRIQNGRLVDNNGTPFVMRGVSYPFTWFSSRNTQQDFTNIANTRANTVRIVLSTGTGGGQRSTGAQLANLIQWCKDRRMIAVLEVHTSTGWGDNGSPHITDAVNYWRSADVFNAVRGQENFVIINIANEPFGNNSTGSYVNDTINAIRSLRTAGYTHNLMVDGANWGQDWSNTMRNNATQIFNGDPQRNVTFSVHMYEVYSNGATATSYMQSFANAGMPLVIGEFGADHQGQPVDEGTIMSQAQQRGLGYIGWSWSGNGSCCLSLDIVSNFGTSLTSWGNILVNGSNGIRNTAVPASVFDGTTPNPEPGTLPAAGTYSLRNRASGKMLDNLGSTADGANVGQWADGSSNNQRYVLSYTGGFAKLMCVTGSKFLDSINRTADNTAVGQWASSSSFNQQWTIQPISGSPGWFRIVNRANGKALDTGGATNDGGIMEFWSSGSTFNQQWQFVAP